MVKNSTPSHTDSILMKKRLTIIIYRQIIIKNAITAPILNGAKLIGQLFISGNKSSYYNNHYKLLKSISDHLAPLLNSWSIRRTEIDTLKKSHQLLEIHIKERTKELEQTQIEIIDRLGMAAEYRDEETGNHTRRIGKYCGIMGEAAGLHLKECKILALASTMHDIGKIAVPAEILSKPGRISDPEFRIIKQHSKIGYDILKKIEVPWPLAEIVYQHHEKLDATNYCIALDLAVNSVRRCCTCRGACR